MAKENSTPTVVHQTVIQQPMGQKAQDALGYGMAALFIGIGGAALGRAIADVEDAVMGNVNVTDEVYRIAMMRRRLDDMTRFHEIKNSVRKTEEQIREEVLAQIREELLAEAKAKAEKKSWWRRSKK